MNKDMHSIYETYRGTAANKEILEEGLFDRLKARGAQAVGAVKGLGAQAAGTVKGAVAGAKGNVADVQAAQQQRKAGAIQGQLSKVESYRKSAVQKMSKSIDDIINDLTKLGYPPQSDALANFKNATTQFFNQNFDNLVSNIKQQGGVGEEDCEWSNGEEDCDEMVDGVKTKVELEPQVKPTKFFK